MGRKQRSDRKPGKREPNGQLSRADEFARARRNAEADEAQWEAMSVGIEARHRLYGLAYPASHRSAEPARRRPHVLDQRAGSVIGRMTMQGELTPAQYDAALKYAEDVENYRRAISAPRIPGAVDLNAVRGNGIDNAEHVEFVLRAVRRYCGEDGRGGLLARLRETQSSLANRGQNLMAALDYFVLRDEFHAHMLPWLRTALNSLSIHYGLLERTEAA